MGIKVIRVPAHSGRSVFVLFVILACSTPAVFSFFLGGGGISECVCVCVRARVFRWCSLWFLVCLGWLSLLFFLFQGQKSSLYIMNVRSHEMDFIINILSIPVSMFIFHVSIFVLHVSKRLAAQVTHEVFLPCVFGITVVAECLE